MLPPDRIHSLICQVCTELDERCREEILFASRCGIEYALAAPGRKDARYGVAVKTGLMQKKDNTLVFIDEIQAYDRLLTLLKFLREDNQSFLRWGG